MRFTKRLTIIVTSLSLAGMLAGCGSSSSSTSSNPASSSSKSSTPAVSPSVSTKTVNTASTATVQTAAASKKPQNSQGTLNSSLQSLMKVDSTTMQKDVQSGKSLADIAKSQGVSEQQVIDVLEKNLKQTLDKNVSSGKLTQATEDQLLSNAEVTFKKLVEQKPGKSS